MQLLLAQQRPRGAALVLLGLAALAVAVAGFEHARLFHRGYQQVEVIGPLFLLNGIASAVAVLLLVFDRPLLFVVAALSISVGSLVSIFISHTSSFFSFSEGGYDGDAKVIVIGEIAATVFAIAGALALRRGEATA